MGVARFTTASVEILLCICFTAPGKSVESGSTITLRVANYAHVPDGDLAAAEKKAQRLLRQAEVDTRWLKWPLAEARAGPGSPPRPGDFFLIVAREVIRERRSGRDVLGLALPCRQGQGGCLANIFYSRIEATVEDASASLSDILGAVMAHEVGHLLMGPLHSSVGIMRGEWTRKDLRDAAYGQLCFTPGQIALLQTARCGDRRRGQPRWRHKSGGWDGEEPSESSRDGR